MKPSLQFVPISVLILPFALSSCAGTPPPDLSTPDGAALRQAYSGSWTLVPEDSESFQEMMEEQMANRGSRRPGGGGMRGGGGGRGGGMRGGFDPEEMRRAMEETRRIAGTASAVQLSMEESSVSLIFDSAPPLILQLGADPMAHSDGLGEIKASATWTNNGLEIRREIVNGGDVFDTFKLDDDGRLGVRRDVKMMRGQTEVRVRMVYEKSGR